MASEETPYANWTKEKVEAFLNQLEYSYQKIDLPYGLSTQGVDRSWFFDVIFPKNLEGQTVLDIGSYLGYFCLEACRRNAEEVVGLEIDPQRIQEAKTLAKILNLNPDYQLRDFESFSPGKQYDLVLCLNILHHLFNPISALHKLIKNTKGTLVLEVATLGKHDRSKFSMAGWLLRYLSKESVILVQPGMPRIGKRKESQKYFFSEKALLNILKHHFKVFAKVESFPSKFKNRVIIKAHKYQIDDLIIVAGPTSSGKSSLLKYIQRKDIDASLSSLLPRIIHTFPQIGASKFLQSQETVENQKLTNNHLPGLVLHYDILRPYTTGIHDYHRDQILDLIDCANNVTVLTLWVDPQKLTAQLIESELGGGSGKQSRLINVFKIILEKSRLFFPKVLKSFFKPLIKGRLTKSLTASHHQQILANYQKTGWTETWYDKWDQFLKNKQKKNIVLQQNPEIKHQWEIKTKG